MATKKHVGRAVIGVVVIQLIWVGAAAASIGSEASQMDALLKRAVQNHEPVGTVLQKVNVLGYKMMNPPVAPATTSIVVVGRGPDHWAGFYRTWLTLSVDTGPDFLTHGYHLDRAGGMF